MHDIGAISAMSSDSQAMGRVGEIITRTWQTADKVTCKTVEWAKVRSPGYVFLRVRAASSGLHFFLVQEVVGVFGACADLLTGVGRRE